MNPLEIGTLKAYLNDFSEVIPIEKRKELNELFAEHERNTTEQVVIVLFPHREGSELLDIGMKIFEENGIGQKGKNNGLLLIIATKERKIRIITGKGMELKYSEMRCRDIIENELRPLLNDGNFEALIRRFSTIISSDITNIEDKTTENLKLTQSVNNIFIILVSILLFGAGIFADSPLSGIITLGLSIFIYIVIMRLRNTKNIEIGKWIYLLLFFLFVVSIFAIFQPAKCILESESYLYGKKYHCERIVFGHNFAYSKNIGGQISQSNKGGSSWGHSSSSSFGGGGGSSNGGGYGD